MTIHKKIISEKFGNSKSFRNFAFPKSVRKSKVFGNVNFRKVYEN
jgi:hypothetical protein